MRVFTLHRESATDYSCNAYWVLGDQNAATDRNTLIDAGNKSAENFAYYFREMTPVSKGIGKMAVEQVILTHEHYDHSGGLAVVARQFGSVVYSWLPASAKHVPVSDGMRIIVGDQEAVLLHTPGHSDDSICVHLPRVKTLFSGDSVYRINDNSGSYSRAYLQSLERLATLGVEAIYPGHGSPILRDAQRFIEDSIAAVRKSPLVD